MTSIRQSIEWNAALSQPRIADRLPYEERLCTTVSDHEIDELINIYASGSYLVIIGPRQAPYPRCREGEGLDEGLRTGVKRTPESALILPIVSTWKIVRRFVPATSSWTRPRRSRRAPPR